MTEKLSDRLWNYIGAGIPRELATQAADLEAELARLRELIERAEAQMIGEDAQPLPEWEWYFDALEQSAAEGSDD